MSIFKCCGDTYLSIVTFLKPPRPNAEVLLCVTKGALQSEVRALWQTGTLYYPVYRLTSQLSFWVTVLKPLLGAAQSETTAFENNAGSPMPTPLALASSCLLRQG
jgi:hypothetical protein